MSKKLRLTMKTEMTLQEGIAEFYLNCEASFDTVLLKSAWKYLIIILWKTRKRPSIWCRNTFWNKEGLHDQT